MTPAALGLLAALLPTAALAACAATDGSADGQCDAAQVPPAGEHALLQRNAAYESLRAGAGGALDKEPSREGDEECGDAAEDEQCHAAITWAMKHGIVNHPGWYPETLGHSSSFADFQAYFNDIGQNSCPRPCKSCTTAEEGSTCYEVIEWAKHNGVTAYPDLFPHLDHGSTMKEFQDVVHDNNKIAYRKDPPILKKDNYKCQAYMAITGCAWTAERSCPGQMPVGSGGVAEEDDSHGFECCCKQQLWKPVCAEACSICHTAVEGEKCFEIVTWAMEHGIKQHPDWYPGLDVTSSSAAVQIFLHKINQPCAIPCGVCTTAEPGSRCHRGVTWAMQHGIIIHPEWYPDLSARSSFDAFQAHLHNGGFHGCPLPCDRVGDAQTFD